MCLNIMCSSVFPHEKSKTSRGKSSMEKCVDQKKRETSAGRKDFSLKKRHSTSIISESLRRHKQLREYY